MSGVAAVTANGGAVKRRVVVRAAVAVVDPIERERRRLDALAAVVADWVEWMRRDDSRVGFPQHSALVRGAEGCAYENAESARVQAIDAVVSDLPAIQRAAVCRRYGLAAVFRFPRANYAEVLEAANEALIAGLRRKGVDIEV